MKYILALDAGTTSNRAILFDQYGHPLSMAQKEFKQIFPKPGWVEQDPTEIVSTTLGAAVEAVLQSGVSREDIASIGISNQRETTIIWDKRTGLPVYNAIVWQCRRTAQMAQDLIDRGYSQMIRSKTGLVIDAYFSATKVKYILDHIPGLRDRARRGEICFGTVDSYLLFHLSKGRVHATDPSNASRTMLYNIIEEKWDQDILDLLDIPREILPQVLPSSGLFDLSDPAHFGREIPITGILGDQQAALFGQMCFESADIKNTYGTGAFVLMNTGGKPIFSQHGLLTSVAWKINNLTSYALEGSIFNCGSAISWLKDQLNLFQDPKETSTMAESVEDSNGAIFVPAFTGLGTPYWDPEVRGSILGITRGVNKNHIVRATLESIALMSYDVIEAMEKDSGLKRKTLRVDGGVSQNNFLLQKQADILQARVIRPKTVETTALGACLVSALGAGLYSNLDEIKALSEHEKVFEPKMDPTQQKKELDCWHKAVAVARSFREEGKNSD